MSSCRSVGSSAKRSRREYTRPSRCCAIICLGELGDELQVEVKERGRVGLDANSRMRASEKKRAKRLRGKSVYTLLVEGGWWVPMRFLG